MVQVGTISVGGGGIHAFFIIISDYSHNFNQKLLAFFLISPKTISFIIFKRLYVFSLVVFAWIFFRSPNVGTAIEYIKRSLRLENLFDIFCDNISIMNIGINQMNFNILLMALGLLGMVSLIREIKNDAFVFFIRQAPLFRIIYCWVLVFLIVISSDLSSKEFIYFQF